MAGHRPDARPRATDACPAIAARSRRYAEKGEWNGDELDLIAHRQAEAEPVKRIPKMRCQACMCYIGPGYYERNVWYDVAASRWICQSCSSNLPEEQTRMIATETEVAALEVIPLSDLLASRSGRRGTKK